MSVSCDSYCVGAGPSPVMGDQMLFCAAVDAVVTLAGLGGVVRNVTALCNSCSPLYIAFLACLLMFRNCTKLHCVNVVGITVL